MAPSMRSLLVFLACLSWPFLLGAEGCDPAPVRIGGDERLSNLAHVHVDRSLDGRVELLRRLAAQLSGLSLRVVQLPSGVKDVQELTPDKLVQVLANARSIESIILKGV